MANVNSVSFGNAAAAVQTKAPGEKYTFDTYKDKLTNKEMNAEKAITGATVITGIGLAAFLLYRGIKRGKGTQAAGEAAQLLGLPAPAQRNANAVPRTPKQPKQPKPVKSLEEMLTPEARNLASDPKLNYGQVRSDLKMNHSHEEKKVLQNWLNGVHSERVGQQIEAQHEVSSNVVAAINANGQSRTARQVANTATFENLENIQQGIQKQSEASKEAVEKLRERVSANPTRRNTRALRVAENKNIETQKNLAKAAERAKNRAEAVNAGETKRVQNALEYIENTTLEQREAQRETLRTANAVAKERAGARRLKQKLSQPKYQRTVEDWKRRRLSKEAIEKIAKNDKDPIIRELADMIAKTGFQG